jgi:hypothetical protein
MGASGAEGERPPPAHGIAATAGKALDEGELVDEAVTVAAAMSSSPATGATSLTAILCNHTCEYRY